MSLEKLKKEIERLKDTRLSECMQCNDTQLEAIKMVVEEIDEWMFFDHLNQDFKKKWKEIKLILGCEDIQIKEVKR